MARRARSPNATRIDRSTSRDCGATRPGRHLSAGEMSRVEPRARSVKVKPPLAGGRGVPVTPPSGSPSTVTAEDFLLLF